MKTTSNLVRSLLLITISILSLFLPSCVVESAGGRVVHAGGRYVPQQLLPPGFLQNGYNNSYEQSQQAYQQSGLFVAPHGVPLNTVYPPQAGQIQQPHGQLSVVQTGEDHFQGKLNDGIVSWTKNGVAIPASQVPSKARSGFVESLRKRGYQGPINDASTSISPPIPVQPLPLDGSESSNSEPIDPSAVPPQDSRLKPAFPKQQPRLNGNMTI